MVLIAQLGFMYRRHGQILSLVHKIKQMKIVQLHCLLWILYLNIGVLGHRQRGARKGNTRNSDIRYGRRQGNKQQIS